MNDKEQIKRMAKIIKNVGLVDFDGDPFSVSEFLDEVDTESIAEELLKYYQPKIPENAVVLTREEYEKELQEYHNKGVQAGFDMTKFKENSIKRKASKETARECRDFIKQWAGNDEEGLGFLFDFEDFIAKQYGVEVTK